MGDSPGSPPPLAEEETPSFGQTFKMMQLQNAGTHLFPDSESLRFQKGNVATCVLYLETTLARPGEPPGLRHMDVFLQRRLHSEPHWGR